MANQGIVPRCVRGVEIQAFHHFFFNTLPSSILEWLLLSTMLVYIFSILVEPISCHPPVAAGSIGFVRVRERGRGSKNKGIDFGCNTSYFISYSYIIAMVSSHCTSSFTFPSQPHHLPHLVSLVSPLLYIAWCAHLSYTCFWLLFFVQINEDPETDRTDIYVIVDIWPFSIYMREQRQWDGVFKKDYGWWHNRHEWKRISRCQFRGCAEWNVKDSPTVNFRYVNALCRCFLWSEIDQICLEKLEADRRS